MLFGMVDYLRMHMDGYRTAVSLFDLKKDVIRGSVMSFSWAGHNRERFPAWDPLWVEALCEREKERENICKCILFVNSITVWEVREMSIIVVFIYMLFSCKVEKNNNIQSVLSPTCSICITVCRRTISTSEPILIICKSRRQMSVDKFWDNGLLGKKHKKMPSSSKQHPLRLFSRLDMNSKCCCAWKLPWPLVINKANDFF